MVTTIEIDEDRLANLSDSELSLQVWMRKEWELFYSNYQTAIGPAGIQKHIDGKRKERPYWLIDGPAATELLAEISQLPGTRIVRFPSRAGTVALQLYRTGATSPFAAITDNANRANCRAWIAVFDAGLMQLSEPSIKNS